MATMQPSTNESIQAPSEALARLDSVASDAKAANIDAVVAETSSSTPNFSVKKRRRCSNESCDSNATPSKRLPIKSDSSSSSSSPAGRSGSPMSLISLVQARRSSMPHNNNHKPTDLTTATTSLTLDSATRRRFPRRSSHVADMMMAKSRASQIFTMAYQQPQQQDPSSTTSGATPEEAQALGYNTEEPAAAAAAVSAQPPIKRRRYQRRNSFVVPETSRSSGQQSGFSWRAMDFLYGRSPSAPAASAAATSEQALRELGMPTLLRRESPPAVAAAASAVDQRAS